MTNPQPNPNEPSREQVAQQTAIKFLDSVGLATGGVTEDLLTAEINATLIRETEKLRETETALSAAAIKVVTDESDRFASEIKTLQQQLADANAKVGIEKKLVEFFADDMKKLSAERDSLRSTVQRLEAKCGEKDKALKPIYQKLCSLKMSHPHLVHVPELDMLRDAISADGNTLLERVKGLEDVLWSARDWIEDEQCDCQINHICIRCNLLKQINAQALTTEAKG